MSYCMKLNHGLAIRQQALRMLEYSTYPRWTDTAKSYLSFVEAGLQLGRNTKYFGGHGATANKLQNNALHRAATYFTAEGESTNQTNSSEEYLRDHKQLKQTTTSMPSPPSALSSQSTKLKKCEGDLFRAIF